MAEHTPIDDRLVGLNLTRAELQYVELKKIYGLKQVEVQEHLRWDDATFQRVKRSADRKLKLASPTIIFREFNIGFVPKHHFWSV